MKSFDDKTSQVNTTLSNKEIKFIRDEMHWKYNELIRLGVLAKKNNPQMLVRLREVEDDRDKLMNKIRQLGLRIMELEQEKDKKLIEGKQ